MLTIQPASKKLGIKISGDFQDIQHLIKSAEHLYHKINQSVSQNKAINADLLGDLLFHLRAAIQGTRQIESVNNGANNMGQLFIDLETAQAEDIRRQRRRYKHGNLYYTVTINSIEVIGYLRCFHEIFSNESFLILENGSPCSFCTEKAMLYQFYCLLRHAVYVLLGEDRMQKLMNQYEHGIKKQDFIPYEYEFLNYLKSSFLYHCGSWNSPEIEKAIFGLSLLQCQTPKCEVLLLFDVDSVYAFLDKTPDSTGFPALYDKLAAQSDDGQVYMDEVFPNIDNYLTVWENICR